MRPAWLSVRYGSAILLAIVLLSLAPPISRETVTLAEVVVAADESPALAAERDRPPAELPPAASATEVDARVQVEAGETAASTQDGETVSEQLAAGTSGLGIEQGQQPSGAPSESPRIAKLDPVLERVAADLGAVVAVMPHPSNPREYYVLRQAGDVLLVRLPSPEATSVLDLTNRVGASGEAGLHSMTFHPTQTHRAFLFYNEQDGSLVLDEYHSWEEGRIFDPSTRVERLRISHAYGSHNGGALAFGSDGYLYVSVGDGGQQDDPDRRAQDISSLHGKILRIDVDTVEAGYAIPSSNPLVGVAKARAEVWLAGFRNPWRMHFDGATGDLWIADVGGSVAEEVNHHPASRPGGANYGWHVFEGSTRRWNDPIGETIAPVHEYRPTSGRCAITGGLLYRGPLETLDGRYVFSDFCDGKLRALAQEEGGAWAASEVTSTGGLVVDIKQDHDGSLLILHHGGTLWRYGALPTE